MGQLGEVLERMADAGRVGQDLRAVVTVWRDREGQARSAARVFQREVALGRCVEEPPRYLLPRGDPVELTEEFVLEARPPDIVRMERLTAHSPPWKVWMGYLPAPGHPLAPLFACPLPLAADLRLDVVGTGEVAKRPTVRLRGRPRPTDWRHPRFFGPGFDDHLLDVDAERGTLLRFADRLDGAEIAIVTVRPLADEEPLPVPAVSVPPPAEAIAGPVELSPEEAARRAHFTVVRPRRGPEGTTISTELQGAVVRMRMALMDGRFAVRIEQRALDDECDEDLARWEQLVGDRGVRYCWSARHVQPAYSEEVVLVDREGTRVTLRSRLSRALLLEIADSLEVVSAGSGHLP